MNFITAEYIFPVTAKPLKNSVLLYDDYGVVKDLLPAGQINSEKIKYYNGVLVPGFVNAHLHLELSYLKNQIESGGGLSHFIPQILAKRQAFTEDTVLQAIEAADNELWHNGVIAAGDISNTNISFNQKGKSKIAYHTFIELFDIKPEHTSPVFENGIALTKQLSQITADSLSAGHYSLTPHAPYSVTDQLFSLLNDVSEKNKFILSIHNQETESENELFRNRSGDLFNLFRKMDFKFHSLKDSEHSGLHHTLKRLHANQQLLLVHNTYTTAADIEWAQTQSKNLYWCFCPNANLFIENALPHYNNFIKANATCCIGTDSYASNYKLSILDEMKTITGHASAISFETLLKWATINGARYLKMDTRFGSFEKGKQPGINLITNFDMHTMSLTPDSEISKII